ncbi:MAG: asparagine synthase (glutamine-hydrolyzing) [Myxococcota bacterium]
MCGFSGVLGPRNRAAAERVGAMTRRLRHRGPDDFGTWQHDFALRGSDYALGFGHARLSILDTSDAGHQPMTSSDGRVTITYNGEIYNFRELRDELATLGHAFRTECDTEVVLESYRAWGCEAFDRFIGMFAFALWDHAEQRLVLVRDRLGIKPLYYGFWDGVLCFGSELSALRVHPAFPEEIDSVALGSFVRHGYVAGPRTIYRHAARLMPGELVLWEAGALERRRYWSLLEPEAAPVPSDFEEAVRQLDELLGDAVERRLVSDVPLGAFLSGGIDSSAVVALMKERARGPVRTFSIGFRQEQWDEAPHARRVAEHLGTEHTELYVGVEDAVGVAREIYSLYDEPFADSSAVPTVLLSRLTREHVTVALSGDGGDELFGGYWQYWKLRTLLRLHSLPTLLRSGLRAAAGWLPSGPLRNGLLHLESPDAAHLAYALLCGCREETLAALCGAEAARPNPVYLESFHAAPVDGDVRRAMLADARVYLPDDILTKVDRASMSVALEARVPILDHRVARFAFRLPLDLLWHGGEKKAPLRGVLYRRVPREILERPKQGFSLPITALLGDELRSWAKDYLEPGRLREEGHFAPEGVSRLLEEARRRGGEEQESEQLWRLLTFQRWFARHHGAERPAAGA